MTEAPILEALPARPLTFGEVEHLAEGVPESMKIAPGSALTTPRGPVIPILHVTLFDKEESRYYGFNEDVNGWELIDTWTKESWDQTEIEETIEEWGKEQIGEEFVEHGIVDEDGIR